MGWTTTKEQRTKQRVAAQMPVRYRVHEAGGQPGEEWRSKTTNISCEGIAFLSPVHIPITARLSLAITLPDRNGTLAAEGTVVRIARELPEERGFEYGVALDMDTVSDARLLDAFVRSINIFPLLELMTRRNATDMHLTPYSPPVLRVHHKLAPTDTKALSPQAVETLVYSLLGDERREELLVNKETHFAFMVPEVGRWRASVYQQRGCVEAVFHAISEHAPTLYDLDYPENIHGLLRSEGGLILVSGGLRSGKSTTLAAFVDAVNNHDGRVISTIEDPIEFVHENARGVVKQREIGHDTPDLVSGIRHILRQDPDVIVLDAPLKVEALDVALHAADTGRLVFAAVNASSAPNTLERIAMLYPTADRARVLRHLARSLRAICWQVLLPSMSGDLVLATEMIVMSDSICNAIAQDHLDLMSSLMDNTQGCVPLDVSLRRLLNQNKIDTGTALQVARFPEQLQPSGVDRRLR